MNEIHKWKDRIWYWYLTTSIMADPQWLDCKAWHTKISLVDRGIARQEETLNT